MIKETDNSVLLCADIGGTWIKLALITPEGSMIKRWRIKTNLTDKGKYIPGEITTEFKQALSEDKFKDLNAIGMGIGIPGFPALDGVVKFSGNIGWRNYDIRKDLLKDWNFPIAVHNDCDMAALGEKFIGKGKNSKNFVFITLGTGMGAGIIINNKLYQGAGGTAGEFGHIPLQNQFQCTCGLPECAEPIFSATGLVNLFQKYQKLNPHISSSVQKLDGRLISDAAKEQDLISIKAMEEFAEYGGRLLATIAMTFNPELVLLGGGLAHDNDLLLKYLYPVYERFTHDFIRETTKITLAGVGNDSGLYGAAYSALELIKEKQEIESQRLYSTSYVEAKLIK